VPNTFVMFANKPGLPSAVRSDFGLMGPFTEALIYALQNSSGAVTDVYALASKKAAEISPGQQPVMYHSRTIDPIVLAPGARTRQHDRAKELLNSAEPFYQNRQWGEFRATVNRGKALAAGPDLQQRLASEADFAGLVITAEALEKERKWADAAARWQKAGDLFDRRHWVAMRAAVAWLLADDPAPAVRALAVMAAQADGDLLSQAKQMLAELVQAFPALQPEAEKAARSATKPPAGAEFEKVRDQE
jgi:hypothetical protein